MKSRQYFVVLIGAVMAFSMWFFVNHISPHATTIATSDLYPRWYGARELLLRGKDPYGAEVTAGIQTWTYGKPLQSTVDDHRDEQRFAYPVYIVFVLSPSIWLPFSNVQTIFSVLLPVLVLLSVLLWADMLRWQPSRFALACALLLTLFCYPAQVSLYLQQPVILAVAFLAAAGAALRRKKFILAGILLAFATIKPQMCMLLAVWLLLWTFTDFRRRKSFALAFCATLGILIAFSELWLPGWGREFLHAAANYQRYTGALSILELFLGKALGLTASGLLVLGVGFLLWRNFGPPADSEEFQFSFCLILITTLVIIPTIYPYGQIALIPPVLFAVKNYKKIWERRGAARLALVASVVLVGAQWVEAFALTLGSGLFSLEQMRRYWLDAIASITLVPLSLLVLFLILGKTELRLASGAGSEA